MSRLFFYLLFVITLWFPSLAGALDVREVRMGEHDDHTRVVVELSDKGYFRVTNLSGNNGTLLLEVFGVNKAPHSVLTSGRERIATNPEVLHNSEKKWFRLSVKTAGPVRTENLTLSNPYRIVLDIFPTSATAIRADAAQRQQSAPAAQAAPGNGAWQRRIIVDPGHGGYHKGGVGKLNGRTVYEKEVTIRVAEKMERLLMADPRFDVRLTRRKDLYMGLRERTALASQMRGDMFISLHCNAVDGKAAQKARGFEIWTWNRDGSEKAAAKALEGLENADPGVSNKNNRILNAMMYDALERQALVSRQVASSVYDQVMTDSSFRANGRGVQAARFTVLEVYDMPSILVEMGFISHPQEVKALFNNAWQDKMAKLLYDGIVRYYEKSDPTFPRSKTAVAAAGSQK